MYILLLYVETYYYYTLYRCVYSTFFVRLCFSRSVMHVCKHIMRGCIENLKISSMEVKNEIVFLMLKPKKVYVGTICMILDSLHIQKFDMSSKFRINLQFFYLELKESKFFHHLIFFFFLTASAFFFLSFFSFFFYFLSEYFFDNIHVSSIDFQTIF